MKPIARLNFAHLPTPIEELPRLTAALDGPRILVKRDDQTGLAFGGNKTRKLEFLVAEAQEQGADMLISAGAIQSNHCRQTVAAAARFGFGCTLVLTGESPRQPSANFLLDQLFGAEIVTVADRKDRDHVLQETFDNAIAAGRKPYLVPYGGSSPTGAMGYTFAMEELMKQWADFRSLKDFGSLDWIVFGTSSGGTHAGLVLGQRLFGFKGKVLGISIDESVADLKKNVSALATRASEKLGERIQFTDDDVLANDDYCQAGYGVFGEGEREAIKLFASNEGLLLDPVYTGRAAAGMIDLIRKGYFKKDETILFWHTGGQPALFADKYSLDVVR
jgi:D-cysteine desulfhydrase family pyridoxal phosphate-dependent enzyme